MAGRMCYYFLLVIVAQIIDIVAQNTLARKCQFGTTRDPPTDNDKICRRAVADSQSEIFFTNLVSFSKKLPAIFSTFVFCASLEAACAWKAINLMQQGWTHQLGYFQSTWQ